MLAGPGKRVLRPGGVEPNAAAARKRILMMRSTFRTRHEQLTPSRDRRAQARRVAALIARERALSIAMSPIRNLYVTKR